LRKLIVAAVALVALAVPTFASAKVHVHHQRAHAASMTSRYETQRLTLTLKVQPNAFIQDSAYVFHVITDPCDNVFEGLGTSQVGDITAFAKIRGTLVDDQIGFDGVYLGPGDVNTFGSTAPGTDNGVALIPVRVSNGAFGFNVTASVVVISTSDYMDHADFVASHPGDNNANHACIGEPILN
jgi:hypothetical protein